MSLFINISKIKLYPYEQIILIRKNSDKDPCTRSIDTANKPITHHKKVWKQHYPIETFQKTEKKEKKKQTGHYIQKRQKWTSI